MDREIHNLLSRGVSQFTDPEGQFTQSLEDLRTGKRKTPVIIKFGVDPTRPDIHLGHAVILQKLRQFQNWGAKIVFLIGDFTAMIGDPTGKSKVRPEISQQEVEVNMKSYLEQVGKILDLSPEKFSWIRNSDWFTSPMDILPNANLQIAIDGKSIEPNSFVGKAITFEKTRMQATHLHHREVHTVSLVNVLSMLRKLTHARLIERDLFQERIKGEMELYLHELLYPVFQGIDSHIIAKIYGSCDLEIGGSDQTFNMLFGRDIMKVSGQPPQAVMALDLLVGTDGKEKMSKSLDNYIGITDLPADMYGKIMSVPDTALPVYLSLATFTPVEQITDTKMDLEADRVNPRDIKMSLARQIVAIYHGEKNAQEAEMAFIATFQKGEIPKERQIITAVKGTPLVDILVEKGILASKTIAKRYIQEGALSVVGGEKITDNNHLLQEEITLRVGKKLFIQIVPESI